MARPHWLALLPLLLAALPLPAQDLPPGAAALRLRTLAATCAACHGTEGRALPDSPVPGLAGLPAGALKQALLAFKSGARPGTVMPQLAKGYEDAQLAALADYFAALAPEPDKPAAPPPTKEPRP